MTGSRPWLAFAPLVFACSCAAASPTRGERAVAVAAEDDEALRRGLACRETHGAELASGVELSRPALRGDARGLAVAWVEQRPRDRAVRAARLSEALTVVEGPVEVPTGEEMPRSLAVAACGVDTLVAWQQRGSGGDALRAALVRGGRVSSAWVLAPDGREPSASCVDDSPFVTWTARSTTGVRDVMGSWVVEGRPADDPLRLSGETDSASMPAAGCGQGRCAVVWTDLREGAPEIYGTVVERGEEEAPPSRRVSAGNASTSGAGGAYRPSAATSERGFLVAWDDGRGRDAQEVYAATFGGRGPAAGGHRVSASPAPSTWPAVAACTDGAVVAWRDRRDGAPGVWAAAVDHRGRRISAAFRVSGASDEASAPAAACVGGRVALAWTEALQRRARLRAALVECR